MRRATSAHQRNTGRDKLQNPACILAAMSLGGSLCSMIVGGSMSARYNGPGELCGFGGSLA